MSITIPDFPRDLVTPRREDVPAIAPRPAPPVRGLGAWLRARVGVSEDLFRYTPETRPYYAKLGTLVLTTSGMATASALTALTKFVDAPLIALVPLAIFWGFVVFVIDTWLIISIQTTGKSMWALIGRLTLAVLLGLVISEPLILKIFEPAIHREVDKERVQDRADRESALKACNPVPYRPLAPADQEDCAARRLLLSVPTSPGGITESITSLNASLQAKQKSLEADRAKLGKLQEIARRECNGGGGAGFTGTRGDGPACGQDAQAVSSFERAAHLDQRQTEVSALQSRVDDLIGARDKASATYAGQITAAIQAMLPPAGPIGLLEEDKALDALGSQSMLVLIGPWILRLVLIIIDCLPVITKYAAKPTSYDRLLARQLATNEAVHAVDNELQRRTALADKLDALGELDARDQARAQSRTDRAETKRVQADQNLQQRIDDRAMQLSGMPRSE